MTELLAKAREANDIWVVGWGCKLRRLPEFRLLQHEKLVEYNTIYDITEPEHVETAIELAERIGATIYLPRDDRFNVARRRLIGEGWKAVFRTETLGASIAEFVPVQGERLVLQRVDEASLNAWITLYCINYELGEELLDINSERWTRAFRSEPAIKFYLILVGGEATGTVQLVLPGNGFSGVYALSMSRSHRGLRALGALYGELIRESLRLGADWTCFERLRHVERDPGIRRGHSLPIRWHHLEWQILSCDTGYWDHNTSKLQ